MAKEKNNVKKMQEGRKAYVEALKAKAKANAGAKAKAEADKRVVGDTIEPTKSKAPTLDKEFLEFVSLITDQFNRAPYTLDAMESNYTGLKSELRAFLRGHDFTSEKFTEYYTKYEAIVKRISDEARTFSHIDYLVVYEKILKEDQEARKVKEKGGDLALTGSKKRIVSPEERTIYMQLRERAIEKLKDESGR